MTFIFRRGFLAAAGSGAVAAALPLPVAAQKDTALPDESGRSLQNDVSLGDHVLQFEFPGLEIGAAAYPEGPTGCTVFNFPDGAMATADIRGGAPGTLWTDQIRNSAGWVTSICLAGGSLYGFEAATGVAAEHFRRREYSGDWRQIAGVTGAIIYDFRGRRQSSIVPDKSLGIAALRAARPGAFALGARGAGINATCGKCLLPEYDLELTGQGGAFRQIGPVKIAVFTVVNSVGGIVDRSGKVVRGFWNAKSGTRAALSDLPQLLERKSDLHGNTTLTVLVTNVKFNRPDKDLYQLARSVHASMSRSIQPFHMPTDGDVFFAATTGELNLADPPLTEMIVAGSEVAWDAVLSCFVGRDP
jgi:L-aminopeptidase/D-esterase-like protein